MPRLNRSYAGIRDRNRARDERVLGSSPEVVEAAASDDNTLVLTFDCRLVQGRSGVPNITADDVSPVAHAIDGTQLTLTYEGDPLATGADIVIPRRCREVRGAAGGFIRPGMFSADAPPGP